MARQQLLQAAGSSGARTVCGQFLGEAAGREEWAGAEGGGGGANGGGRGCTAGVVPAAPPSNTGGSPSPHSDSFEAVEWGLARGDRERPLTEAQRLGFQLGFDTGYKRVSRIERASRNGRVSSSLIPIRTNTHQVYPMWCTPCGVPHVVYLMWCTHVPRGICRRPSAASRCTRAAQSAQWTLTRCVGSPRSVQVIPQITKLGDLRELASATDNESFMLSYQVCACVNYA